MKNKQMIWCIVAAISAGGVMEPSALAKQAARRGERAGGCDELDVPVNFAADARVTREGYLHTTDDYAVRIDQITMNPCRLEVSQDAPVTEASCGDVSIEGRVHSLSLQGVSLKGRVFDLREGQERLPGEGVVIEGELPVQVLMTRGRRQSMTQPWRSEEIVQVAYEIPTAFFDQIDWSKLAGE